MQDFFRRRSVLTNLSVISEVDDNSQSQPNVFLAPLPVKPQFNPDRRGSEGLAVPIRPSQLTKVRISKQSSQVLNQIAGSSQAQKSETEGVVSRPLEQFLADRDLHRQLELNVIDTNDFIIIKKRNQRSSTQDLLATISNQTSQAISQIQNPNQLQVFAEIHNPESMSIQNIRKDKRVDLGKLASDICLCNRLNQNCWTIQRYKLAIQFFKDELKAVKQQLSSAKIFQNLVIHDMRNPTTQINWSLNHSREKLAEIDAQRAACFRSTLAELTRLKNKHHSQFIEREAELKRQLFQREVTISQLQEQLQDSLSLQARVESLQEELGMYKASHQDLLDDIEQNDNGLESRLSDLEMCRKSAQKLLSSAFAFDQPSKMQILNFLKLIAEKKKGLEASHQAVLQDESSIDFNEEFTDGEDALEGSLDKTFQKLHPQMKRCLTQLSLDDTLGEIPRAESISEWTAKIKKSRAELGRYDEAFSRQMETLESCQHSSMMLLNLINDLLDLAKQEKMTFQLEEQYFDLPKTIEASLRTLSFLAKKKGVCTRMEIKEEDRAYLSRIFGDSNRYEQIFLNFVSNALKFSNSGGEVAVKVAVKRVSSCKAGEASNARCQSAQREGDSAEHKPVYLELEIRICDTGAGISSEGLKNLFVDFSMLKEHRNRNNRGTGLGLSICKQIVQKMGGQVSVESEVDRGTCFIISVMTKSKIRVDEGLDHEQPSRKHSLEDSLGLPLLMEQDSLPKSCSGHSEGINQLQQELKVLLVNDDFTSLLSLETIFNNRLAIAKENIQKANNGLEAYQMAISSHFDLIIMDLQMPIMNGFEASLKIKNYFAEQTIFGASSEAVLHTFDSNDRSSQTDPHAPFIAALSASEMSEALLRDCVDSKIDEAFSVPLDVDQLQKKVIDHLVLRKTILGLNSKPV